MQPGSESGAARVGGAILAGGAGRRMGGAVKAGLLLGGRPLMSVVAGRLAPQCARLAVCAGPEPERLAGLIPPGAIRLADPVTGYAGPLAGLLAALDWAASAGLSDVLTVAVDTPFFPADLGARLAAGRAAAPAAIAITEDGPQGAFGLWRVNLAADLRAALAGGTRKVTDWADAAGAGRVAFPAAPFFNVNRPEDLVEAEARL